MSKKRDARVDAYLANAQPFARPLLREIRERLHAELPELEEDIKWSRPAFVLNGKIVANMAAFRAHCRFHFWDAAQPDDGGALTELTALEQLPSRKAFAEQVRAAVKRIFSAPKSAPKRARAKAAPKELVLPPALSAALAKNKKAKAGFDSLSPSARREYAEWIADAKTDATRERRLQDALAWVAEGKRRNWKYEK